MTNHYMCFNEIQLGTKYSNKETLFSLFSSKADEIFLNLYKAGDGDNLIATHKMKKGKNDVWSILVQGDLNRVYYTYTVHIGNKATESHDPYAVACGVNGNRSMVIDLSSTNPEGFADEIRPVYKDKTDISVVEISVADATADATSNVVNKGKFIGLTESGCKYNGIPTGLDYLANLGVTHVQLMPIYDFGSVDESKLNQTQYNWGYDPYNYNVPEGSYSTDPYNGEVRIIEFKRMIKAIHAKGLGVIMDVVYNHVYDIEGSCFQKTNPDYYFRMKNGKYSDASACGNEFASDMPMARKYIIDSLCYWAKEYHIDGFRFDLMGVLDIETMNLASEELHRINPDIILYGEGWTGGDSTLPDNKRALKANVSSLNEIGAFSDDFRDTVKGHVFDHHAPGFVNGADNKASSLKKCILVSDWADSAEKVINYVSCHDNLTLWDKLSISCKAADREQIMAMNKLAAAIIFTSQGIPFFLHGEEFGRIKHLEDGTVTENSYNLPIEINSIKYDKALENLSLLNYYRGLIAFRKNHKNLRMKDVPLIRESISFVEEDKDNLIAYEIVGEEENIFVAYNASSETELIDLPEGEWKVYINHETSGNTPIATIKNQTEIKGVSCLVAIKTNE